MVEKVDKLGHQTDDSPPHPGEPARRGIADDWPRKVRKQVTAMTATALVAYRSKNDSTNGSTALIA